jgi:hypothetical protein
MRKEIWRVLSLPAALMLWLAGVTSLFGQTTVPLKLSEAIRVPDLLRRSLVVRVPIKCDAEGNIYLRFYQDPRLGESPVLRISADGRCAKTLDASSHPDLADKSIQLADFAVDLRGKLYQVLNTLKGGRPAGSYIVEFDDTGSPGGAIHFKPGFSPMQVAVFPSGEFLVTGIRHERVKGTETVTALTAIVDRRGDILKELFLPGDVKGEFRQAVGVEPDPDRDPTAAISLGITAPGEDGNVYVVRKGEKPFVLVVSPAGEVVRRVEIAPPREEFRTVDVRVSGASLLVQLVEHGARGERGDRYIYAVLDWETGEVRIQYDGDEIGGMFACYTPNAFTFLTTRDAQMYLYRARLR